MPPSHHDRQVIPSSSIAAFSFSRSESLLIPSRANGRSLTFHQRFFVRDKLMQGPHQVPQKRVQTTFPRYSLNLIGLPSMSSPWISIDPSRQFVLASVDDTGPGLAPEVTGHLFEPFFTTKAEGTGLGLAIAREIALAHRGDLRAANRPDGPGASFTIVLPVSPALLNGEPQ